MSKTLRVFCLTALVLALAVGPAMAIDMTLPKVGSDAVHEILSPDRNVIDGAGDFTGSVLAAQSELPEALDLATTTEITFKPRTNHQLAQSVVSPDDTPLQVVVNWAPDHTGRVIVRGSNGGSYNAGLSVNGPDFPPLITYYVGGTVLRKGTLGITHYNALGQRWVAMYSHNNKASAPKFQLYEVSNAKLGSKEFSRIPSLATGAQKWSSVQPFYLLWDGITGVSNGALRYSTIDVPQGDYAATDEGLRLDNGLDQRFILAEYWPDWGVTDLSNLKTDGLFLPGLDIWTGAHSEWQGMARRPGDDDTWPAGRTTNFVRLVKTGKGRLFIEGGTNTLAGAEDLVLDLAYPYTWDPDLARIAPKVGVKADTKPMDSYLPVDGAFHRGGTSVEGGTLIVRGGLEDNAKDHYRGSLGRTWQRVNVLGDDFRYQGSDHPWAGALGVRNFSDKAGANFGNDYRHRYYNPLYIENDAHVIVDRSQFFTDFNIAGTTSPDKVLATFQGRRYNIRESGYHLPQIAVGLGQRDSYAKGLLTGQFDLVLDSLYHLNYAGSEGGDDRREWIGDAVLYITNPDNTIDDGATLIADGVLEIAGAKSIGPDSVDVGTDSYGYRFDGRRPVPVRVEGDVYVYENNADQLYSASGVRGFRTNERAVFAASKSFNLPQPTNVWGLGMLAVEKDKTFSFSNVTLKDSVFVNFDLTPEARMLQRNADPFEAVNYYYNRNSLHWADSCTELQMDVQNAVDRPGGIVINPNKGRSHANFWSGTVEFGGEGRKWTADGVERHPTSVLVAQGVWQLNSLPEGDPRLNVGINQTGVLSFAKGVKAFDKILDVFVANDGRIRIVPGTDDVVATREAAMAKDAVLNLDVLNFRPLGDGEKYRDYRFVVEVDPVEFGGTIPAGWMKAIFARDAQAWNNAHFLRETSSGKYEDYSKVRVAWKNSSDLIEVTEAEAFADEASQTILINFKKAVTDPVDTDPEPTPTIPPVDSTSTVGSGSYDDAQGVFVLTLAGPDLATDDDGKIIKLKDADGNLVDVTDVQVLVGGQSCPYKAQFIGGAWQVVVNVKDVPAGTRDVRIVGKLGDDRTIQTNTVSFTKPGGDDPVTPDEPTSSSSSGGCDTGFGALALLAGAALILRKRG